MSGVTEASTLPESQRCPIGSLGLHTYNAEHTECIWCGPNRLAWQPGRWVDMEDGFSAWTAWGPLTKWQTEESNKEAAHG